MKLLNRRDFLRLSAGLGVGVFIAACAPAQTTEAPKAEEKPAEKAAEAKPVEKAAGGGYPADFAERAANKDQFNRLPSDHKKGTLVSQAEWYEILGEVPKEPLYLAAFRGGWGDQWANLMVEPMKKEHPGAEVTQDFDPRIWEKMQARMVAGDVPDWMYSTLGGWGGGWKQAVEDGLVLPGDFLLDIEAYGFPGKRLEEVIFPGALEEANGGLTDHQWTWPMFQWAGGIYYNANLFEQHSWPQPDTITWEEFMDLQAEIAKVMPPWTYQGKYPGYFEQVLGPLEYKKAGPKAFCDMDNLVEGAFTNPDIIWSIEQVQQIFKNGWIFPGSEAMTHTESQQIFVDGKAAMVPCGSWLENEQRETTPKDFRMKLSSVPAPKDAKGHKFAINAYIGSADMQIGNGKNPLWAMELMRLFYTPTMRTHFAEKLGSPISMIDALEGATTSEALKSAVEVIAKSEGHYARTYYGGWYPTVGKPFGDAWGDILWSKISAKEIQEITERAAAEARADSTITKYTRTTGCE